jgi:hypothetical protein
MGMETRKFTWRDRLVLLLAKLPSKRMARRVALGWQEGLAPPQLAELYLHVDSIRDQTDSSKLPNELAELLYSVDAILANPFLVHYIRPAIRMAKANGYEIGNIPIITNPSLTFGGAAVPLPNLCIAELPLGIIFMLREIARGIVSLNNTIQYKKIDKSKQFAYSCSVLSLLMFDKFTDVYPIFFDLFEATTPISEKIFATQATHVLGVFLILHEIGHICCNHDFTLPKGSERRKRQEHEADLFAVECLFAIQRDNPRYTPLRDIMLVYICGLFAIMETGADCNNIDIEGYPRFQDRYLEILAKFDASGKVRKAVMDFHFEVRLASEVAKTQMADIRTLLGKQVVS